MSDLMEKLSVERKRLIERAMSPTARSSGFDLSRDLYERAASLAYQVEQLRLIEHPATPPAEREAAILALARVSNQDRDPAISPKEDA